MLLSSLKYFEQRDPYQHLPHARNNKQRETRVDTKKKTVNKKRVEKKENHNCLLALSGLTRQNISNLHFLVSFYPIFSTL